MKELSKLSFQYLKANKLRSILTMLSIMIAIAFLSSLLLFQNGSSDYTTRQEIYLNGDYQIHMNSQYQKEVFALLDQNQITDHVTFSDVGVSQRDDGCYILIKSLDRKTDIHNIQVWEGRLPETKQEVLISQVYAEKHKLTTGSSISIAVGERVLQEQVLSAGDSVLYTDETVEHIKEYQNLIVSGIYQPQIPSNSQAIQDEMVLFQAGGKEGITYLKLSDHSVSNFHQIQEKYPEIMNETGRKLLFHETIGNQMQEHVISVMIIVISLFMMFLVRNIFTISLEEKKKFIGMLNSMGATHKQVLFMVMIEALIYAAITIPLGLSSGYVITGLLFHQLSANMLELGVTPLTYELIIQMKQILEITILIIVIICLSGYLALRKLKAVTPIMLIRNHKKQRKIKLKSYHITEKLFGSSAVLGLRYQKNQGRGQQLVTMVMMISFILFFSSSFLIQSLSSETQQNEYVIVRLKNASNSNQYQSLLDIVSKMQSLETVSEVSFTSELLLDQIQFPEAIISEQTRDNMKIMQVKDFSLNIVGIMNRDVSLSKGQAILAQNYRYMTDDHNQSASFFNEQLTSTLSVPVQQQDGIETRDVTLAFQLTQPDSELASSAQLFKSRDTIMFQPKLYVSVDTIFSIMQEFSSHGIEDMNYSHSASVYGEDPDEVLASINTLKETYPDWIIDAGSSQESPETLVNYSYYMIFLGIASMIVGMSLLNLCCVLISQLLNRKEENFIVLSLGLESKQINTLLFFESGVQLLYAFFLSVPISILLSYLLYTAIFPTGSMVISIQVLGIGLVVIVCFILLLILLGRKTLKEQEMIRNIKNDS